MKNVTALISALVVTFAAPFASAYSVINSQSVAGIVEKVDVENNQLVVNRYSGETATIALPSQAKIDINGKSAELAHFSEGDKVRVKRTTVTPASESISGKIVSLNKSKNTASIRTEEGKVVKVKLGKNMKVSGLVEADSIKGLRTGYEVTIAAK